MAAATSRKGFGFWVFSAIKCIKTHLVLNLRGAIALGINRNFSGNNWRRIHQNFLTAAEILATESTLFKKSLSSILAGGDDWNPPRA
jgi:hypothetical protein